MIAAFIVIAALMAAVALACVLWPLVRRQGDERAPVALVAALSFALPALALALYFGVGTPAAIDATQRAPHAATADDVNAALANLEAHLAEQPDDVQGWILLGRSYQAMQRTADAAMAFDKALALSPDDANLLAAAAEARSLASPDHHIDAGTRALLEKAVRIDPRHQRALWLLGIADYQDGDYATAAETWSRLQPLLDPASEVAKSVGEQIELARAHAGTGASSSTAAPATAASTASSANAAPITLHVSLDASLHADPDAAVFVYARAIDGPAVPLAVARLRVADLPTDVHLDDGDAMTPQFRLSMFPRVTVSARVSASGNAQARPGDLESAAATVDTATPPARIDLVIDHVRD